jgi:hypothetical protein
MTNAIVEKLRTELAGLINTECKVVYVLCEIRKLLENHKQNVRWFTLRLHCHWALHVDLDRPTTTLQFLGKVDTYIANTWDTPSATITVDREGNIIKCEVPKLDPIFQDFGFLETFRKELGEFLAEYGLSTMLCDDNTRWSKFLPPPSVIPAEILGAEPLPFEIPAFLDSAFGYGGNLRFVQFGYSYRTRHFEYSDGGDAIRTW